jgi:hypothetical protein
MIWMLPVIATTYQNIDRFSAPFNFSARTSGAPRARPSEIAPPKCGNLCRDPWGGHVIGTPTDATTAISGGVKSAVGESWLFFVWDVTWSGFAAH